MNETSQEDGENVKLIKKEEQSPNGWKNYIKSKPIEIFPEEVNSSLRIKFFHHGGPGGIPPEGNGPNQNHQE